MKETESSIRTNMTAEREKREAKHQCKDSDIIWSNLQDKWVCSACGKDYGYGMGNNHQ